jgi:hypothetical protein
MPLTRDSPSIQGDVPGPDPARAPPSKAVAGGARLSGAAGGGLPCQARPATRSAAAPTSGRCLVHVWSTRHRNPAVRNGSQRYMVRNGRQRYIVRPGRRTLIRMRPLVQVQPGPPAVALTCRNARSLSYSIAAVRCVAFAQRSENASCTAQRGNGLPCLTSVRALREHGYRAVSSASLACGRLEAEMGGSRRGV